MTRHLRLKREPPGPIRVWTLARRVGVEHVGMATFCVLQRETFSALARLRTACQDLTPLFDHRVSLLCLLYNILCRVLWPIVIDFVYDLWFIILMNTMFLNGLTFDQGGRTWPEKLVFLKKGMLIYLNQYWRVVRVKWPKCSWSFACLLDFLRFMADTEMLLICFVFLSFLFPTWYDTYIFWHTFSSIVIIYFYLWSFYFWVFFMFVIFSEFF